MVYRTKVQTMLALNQADEAERFAQAAMNQEQAGDRRIKEVELTILPGQIAQRRNQPERVIDLFSRAVSSARTGHVQRLLAGAEENLAGAYLKNADLMNARRHALATVSAPKSR